MSQKSVFITGAGSGLGREMALYYAARGDRVCVADLSKARAQETLAMLDGTGHFALEMNVAEQSDWKKSVTKVKSKFGALSVLVNNAGVASSGDFLDLEDAEWDRVLAVNLTSVQRGCKAMLPLMLPQGAGLILNTASFAGLAGAPNTGVYGLTKAAVVAYSEILRGQLYERGIHVACLCPSFFKTNLLESFTAGHDDMRLAAAKMMERSSLNAADVARYAIEHAERGEFMLLPHSECRTQWRAKRWFPEFYFKQMLRLIKQFGK
jgi:NAD(P)-dependent dehydrogenase (short-subunit alcohol dehydrogenase family)